MRDEARVATAESSQSGPEPTRKATPKATCPRPEDRKQDPETLRLAMLRVLRRCRRRRS